MKPTVCTAIFLLAAGWLAANPEPDIPVSCEVSGEEMTVTVMVDPRCFAQEPMSERWFMKADLDHCPKPELEAVLRECEEAISRWVIFDGGAALRLVPVWKMSFTGLDDAVPQRPDDPVVVKAAWRFKLPTGMTRWRVCSPVDARFAVVVRYGRDGQWQDRVATLFPGECARWLELLPR